MAHENVVRLLGVLDDARNDALYLVLEYVDGGPLLAPGGEGRCYAPIDQGDARRAARDVARGAGKRGRGLPTLPPALLECFAILCFRGRHLDSARTRRETSTRPRMR